MSLIKPMAFPSPVVHSEKGLTKLEYFAGLAMQGILANAEHALLSSRQVAEWSMDAAMVLIAELEKAQ